MSHTLHFPMGKDFNMQFYASLSGEPMPPFIYPHHIEKEIELFILVDGDVSFAVESRVYKMKRGDIIITRPNEMHHCIRNSTTVNHHYCFHFDPSCDSIFSAFLDHAFGTGNLISPTEEDRELILSLADRIIRSAEDSGDELLRLALTLEMLSAVKRGIGERPNPEKLPATLEAVLAEIDEHLSDLSSFDEVCARHFISRSTLTRLFKKHLGTTPQMYLESKRLAVAGRMLECGTSVSATCRAVGFSDTSSFIRLFKRRFGETPLKYAQR